MKTFINMLVSLVAYVATAMTSSKPAGTYIRRDPCAGANVYAAEYTNAYVTTPAVKNSAAQLGGRVRIARATYTQGAADGAIGDVVYFTKLPQGATPLPFGKMYFGAGNATATLKIGFAGNDACFLAATSIAAAGSAVLDAFAASGAILKNTGTTGLDVIGTNAVAAIKAAQVITIWIPYVMND
ncbi:hypothetical protein F6V25_07970 [Oryzomonas japonica]|uniref:Uncharacterized protein n=1 Tax=Oryzomonas japonica TaxID=2603858 RepID=A0A7J4ZSG1_9BACT|nr:hypothetical protein [Oryzomonas japonica]KAB0665649.1 hypothetical protein F6V25_07970 [Oryzomonas japonica]